MSAVLSPTPPPPEMKTLDNARDKAAMVRGRGIPGVTQPGGGARSSQQEGRRYMQQLEDSWIKLKEDEKRGERECRNALRELEERDAGGGEEG